MKFHFIIQYTYGILSSRRNRFYFVALVRHHKNCQCLVQHWFQMRYSQNVHLHCQRNDYHQIDVENRQHHLASLQYLQQYSFDAHLRQQQHHHWLFLCNRIAILKTRTRTEKRSITICFLGIFNWNLSLLSAACTYTWWKWTYGSIISGINISFWSKIIVLIINSMINLIQFIARKFITIIAIWFETRLH